MNSDDYLQGGQDMESKLLPKIEKLRDALEQAQFACRHNADYIKELDDARKQGLNRIEQLEAALQKANARERPAFMAGVEACAHGADFHDEEQAWQQYRCQDDTDWKALDQETAMTNIPERE